MEQVEAYPFSSEDYTNHPQRALGNPNQGPSMRRDLSSGSYSSNGTYSSISPTSPVTPINMATYYTYNTTGIDQYDSFGDYSSEGYFLESQVIPTPYYEQTQDTNCMPYTNQDPMEAVYGDDFQQYPVMPAPMPDFQQRLPLIPAPMPDDGKGGLHYCLEPGCDSTIGFKRKADLARHFEQLHCPKSQKKQFYCGYDKCERSREPFHRRDHFRDHYRDFHNEDLPRKGGEKPEWYEEKNVSEKWWRCVKCLTKVNIKNHEFRCGSCGSSCDTARRNIRGFE